MNNIHKPAILPIIVASIGFICSPEFTNLLPDKYAHAIIGIGMAGSVIMPSIFKNVKEQQESPQT